MRKKKRLLREIKTKPTMNENLLQYLWKYKIFSKLDFKDTDGNPIEILDFGTLNTNSGPDFSLAKLKRKTSF